MQNSSPINVMVKKTPSTVVKKCDFSIQNGRQTAILDLTDPIFVCRWAPLGYMFIPNLVTLAYTVKKTSHENWNPSRDDERRTTLECNSPTSGLKMCETFSRNSSPAANIEKLRCCLYGGNQDDGWMLCSEKASRKIYIYGRRSLKTYLIGAPNKLQKMDCFVLDLD